LRRGLAKFQKRQKFGWSGEGLAARATGGAAEAATAAFESTGTRRCARKVRSAINADKSIKKSTIEPGSTSRLRCATAAAGGTIGD
jgi:hypothetical protein